MKILREMNSSISFALKNNASHKHTLDLFTAFDSHYHSGKLFLYLFGEYFSKYYVNQKVDINGLIDSLSKKYNLLPDQILKFESAKKENLFEADENESEIFLILKRGLLVHILDCDRVVINYGCKISIEERNELLKLIAENKLSNSKDKKFHMLSYSNDSFELTDFNVKPFNIDLGTHYNDDFFEVHESILSSLRNKNKNGIILLHGKYGSGKTYYLRYLISNIERKFIYLPLDRIERINSPEFIPFMSKFSDSVLILEDCESLLVPREKGYTNSSALSNLLNLGDGLLSDAFSINIICTFNAGIRKIDDAILRKGRLLSRYEFKELELSKAQALADRIGKNVKIDHPMTVSEIYNIDDKDFGNKPSQVLGFKVA